MTDTDIYMTLCDSCAEKMDTERHPENPYYLTQVGGPRVMICPKCFKTATCKKYSAESKTMRAFRREMARRQKDGPPPKKDHRARYRGSWREAEQEE